MKRLLFSASTSEELFNRSVTPPKEKSVIETSIQHFIVARHGDYSGSPRLNPPLNDEGKQQAQRLRDRLRTICGELQITILCSPAKRTLETATIIGEPFGKEPQQDDCFWADDDHSQDLKRSMELVLACNTPIVIVVAHANVTRDLPPTFGKEVLDATFSSDVARLGRAWHLTIATKNMEMLLK